jgi:hypothetical protein
VECFVCSYVVLFLHTNQITTHHNTRSYNTSMLNHPFYKGDVYWLGSLLMIITRNAYCLSYAVRSLEISAEHIRNRSCVITRTKIIHKTQIHVGPVLRRSILRLFTLKTVSKYYLKYYYILAKILGILEPISFNYIIFWSRFTTFTLRPCFAGT